MFRFSSRTLFMIVTVAVVVAVVGIRYWPQPDILAPPSTQLLSKLDRRFGKIESDMDRVVTRRVSEDFHRFLANASGFQYTQIQKLIYLGPNWERTQNSER